MKSNTLSWNDAVSVQKLVDLLAKNKVIVAPSDTVWGLCAAPTAEAFESLNSLKVRNDKPYLLLARDLATIERYALIPQELAVRRLLEKAWPGPLTALCKARTDVPSYLISAEGTIAFRIPLHTGLQRILEHIPVLFSTSANLSGEPVPLEYGEITQSIKAGVGGVILPEKGQERQSGVPSTIVDVSSGQLRIVREGAISKAVIESYRE